jgi:alkylation response protein AidB-like acyl-CoA dehydrogenase
MTRPIHMSSTGSADDMAPKFRAEVRDWLSENLPSGWTPASERYLGADDRWELFGRAWERKLHDGGLAGLSWPVAVGGGGKSLVEEVVLLEELARHGVPESVNAIAKSMLGPTIIAHGTTDQKHRFLTNILSGDDIWCQGFSEPDAGSDLASVRTRATLADGGWRVSGQKIWTSHAARSDWMFALVRSNSDVERHAGLTFILIDLHSPGVEIRPLRQINGDAEFNEVFFTDVFVPDDQVVGQPHDGWKVARTTLGFERGVAHFGRYIRFRRQLDELIVLAGDVSNGYAGGFESSDLRDRLMESLVELEIYRLMARGLITRMAAGAGSEGSLVKLMWTEAYQKMQRLALDVGGAPQLEWDVHEPNDGAWAKRYLNSLSRTIAGGTSEIQRNIIAERLLGLPR